MIRRRDLLLACAAIPVASAAPNLPACDDGDRLAFRVIRNDRVIGSHTLDFIAQDDGFDVRITVDITVTFGPVTLYRYRLRGLEQWRAGTLVHAEAATDDNGTAASMRCDRDGETLWTSGSKLPRYQPPAGALPATHWNMAQLKGPWINIQDGVLFHPTVSARGAKPMRLGDGSVIEAEHYVVSGDVQMELWYDKAQRWAALTTVARDGSVIRYERI
jgi:hypothetical protein